MHYRMGPLDEDISGIFLGVHSRRTNTTKVAPFGPRVDSYFNRILRMFLTVKNFNQMEVYRHDIPSKHTLRVGCQIFHPPLALAAVFGGVFLGWLKVQSLGKNSGCRQATCLHESPPSAKPPSAWPAPWRNDKGKE